METIVLGTGYILAAFADFRTAKEYADGVKMRVSYCGKLEWARPMALKEWPMRVPGLGYMDYRHTMEEYQVENRRGAVPPTYDKPMESIKAAAELLAERQGFVVDCIVVVKRW